MSELVFQKFKGDSSDFINGVFKDTPVFFYKGSTNGIIDEKLTGFDPIDKANIDFIKYRINAAQEEEDMNNTIQWTKNSGKGQNKFLEDKFLELRKLNNEICDFILKNLNRMYWRVKHPNLGSLSDTKSVRSTLDIKKILDVIVPAAEELQKILKLEIDKKYPSVLAAKALQNDINSYNLDIVEKTGGRLGKLKK